MQQGHVQITPVAGLERLLGDAVVEGELVVPEGGHDAGPWSHYLLAFVVAYGECVSDGCQPLHGLDAALSPRVGKARRCVGYTRTR